MTEQMEQMIYNEGYRRGKEEATKELMEWHNKVCEEMAKRHTADRPKGEWCGTVCSNCGASISFYYDCNFCPNCGAKMKGADDE